MVHFLPIVPTTIRTTEPGNAFGRGVCAFPGHEVVPEHLRSFSLPGSNDSVISVTKQCDLTFLTVWKAPVSGSDVLTKLGPNRLATDQVIDALSDLGRLETVDAALMAAARSLADAVDSAPDNASLWREYRAALAELRAVGGEVDDELFSTLASLRTEVRHPENTQSPKSG